MTDQRQQTTPLRFADRVRLIHASADNPQREGFFVERGYRTGKLNPGPFVRITDGTGKFWTASPEHVERLP